MEDVYTTIYKPSEEEVNIHLYPIDGYTMDEYDFTCEIFCSSTRKQILSKSDLRRVDENNYVAIVETAKIGVGKVKIRVLARVPNDNFDDGYRDVVTYLNPKLEVKD